MKYLHTMVHAADLDASLRFYRDALGLEVTRQHDVPASHFTRVCLAAQGQPEAVLQSGPALASAQAWTSMPNVGTW